MFGEGQEAHLARPMPRFRVWSLSKTVVAVMAVPVVAVGLDELVTQHAPELTMADGITIRQLLELPDSQGAVWGRGGAK